MWRPPVNLNEMSLGLSAVQVRARKDFNLAVVSRGTALNCNAPLIATFSGFVYAIFCYLATFSCQSRANFWPSCV